MDTTAQPPRTIGVWLPFALLLVQAVSAIPPGAMLVAGPHGEILPLRAADLEGSPFDSFLVPGLILLLVLGVLPLVAAIAFWRRRGWGWWTAGMVGCGLVIWIAVEVTIIDFSWLQVTYLAMGLAIIAACLPRSVRRYCDVSR